MARDELNGLKVLVTRPADQAGHLCELIEQAGGEAVRFPLLTVEAAPLTPALHALLSQLASCDLAIFISPNAVRFGIEAAESFGGIPATLPIAAVGDGSRRALQQQLGRSVDLAPTGRYDSEALLALPQLQQVAGQRIIIFRGNGGRELLAETLRQRGASVDYAEVYQRRRPQSVSPAILTAWQGGAVNIITVTSNESLQNLYEMVDGAARDWLLGMPLLVVSERGAALAQQLGFRHPALIAGNASGEAIVTTLAGWARERTGSAAPGEKTTMSETEKQPTPSEEQQAQPEHEEAVAAEHEAETTEARQPESVDKPQRRGSPVGLLALLIALIACALAVLLWTDLRELRRSSEQDKTRLQSALTTLQSQEQQQTSALSSETRERDQKLAGQMESLQQQMENLRDQLGHDRIDWMVAESDYLLRYASRRLQLERDVRGALIAMHSADQLLAEGGNPLYLPVREKLNDEIQALEAVPAVDVDGIALELGAISRQADKLPLATARRAIAKYQTQTEESTKQPSGSWLGRLFSAMWHDIKGLVTVHRLTQKIQPLLPPDERYFLIQNLRLRLENARLALLRGDSTLYQDNLQVAAQWLQEYFDNDDAAVKSSLATIQRLAQVNIAPALPETGEALRALEKIRLKGAAKAPSAGSSKP